MHKKLFVGSLIVILVGLWFINYLFFNKEAPKRSKATGAATVGLSFSPSSATGAVNQDFTTTLKVHPTLDMYIRGYEFRIDFDKTKVTVKDIQYKLGAVSAGLGNDNSSLTTVNSQSFIKVQGEAQSATGTLLQSSNPTDVVAVTFTSQSASPYNVTINTPSVKFYQYDSSTGNLNTILYADDGGATSLSVNGAVNPTATPTPSGGPTASPTPSGSPTATPVTSGNVTLNLKLKFQGIVAKPPDAANSMPVRVKLVGPTNADYQTGTFTSDGSGVWSGNVSFNNTTGSGYKVYVKGPKHLQTKICDPTPTETAPITYHCSTGAITLAAGANNFDFSGIVQPVGDLPQQDGVINSYDISLIRNNLDKKDAATLALCDLNLDGICDSQDYSLIIAALSNRGDQE